MTSWSAPPELLQATPRRVALARAGRLTLPIMAIGLFAAFLAIMVTSMWHAHRLQALEDHGVATGGTVTQLYSTSHKGSVSHSVVYRYTAIDPATGSRRDFSGDSHVWLRDFSHLQPGEWVQVVYDPADPGFASLSLTLRSIDLAPIQQAVSTVEMFAALFAICFAMIAAIIGWNLHRERPLARWGIAAQATITGQRQVVYGRRTCTQLTYEFRDASGTVITAHRNDLPSAARLLLPRFRAQLDRILDNPTVLYDPSNSARNLLYPPTALVVLDPAAQGTGSRAGDLWPARPVTSPIR